MLGPTVKFNLWYEQRPMPHAGLEPKKKLSQANRTNILHQAKSLHVGEGCAVIGVAFCICITFTP
eukprot:UN01115